MSGARRFYWLALVVGAPGLLGLLDAWAWVLFDAQATGIDWADGRREFALAFGLIGMCFACVGALIQIEEKTDRRLARLDSFTERRRD